ncbi:hypothetical protein [Chryseobacterium sp. Leaf394]|uniref:hypothetical protein n=1 Tax=Chryseobacterium sp. Leaf394 TaxID=1736361 RepID=UPI000AE47513|nr:hypothetical protein [Chryseobacterium sp. Leaf394]
MEKLKHIQKVVEDYFVKNPSVSLIPAKDMMPYFIKANIFVQDQKNGLPIRKILRELDEKNQLHLLPNLIAERKATNTNWFFVRMKGTTILPKTEKKEIVVQDKIVVNKRANSDEAYILNICDEILNLKGLRQHRFDFLRGDTGTKLPVDIYYPTLKLVIEYREKQHSEEVKFFDKRITASGISRGEQRKRYDEFRRTVIPQNGLDLIEFDYSEFGHTKGKRLLRNRVEDEKIIRRILGKYIN